MYLIMITGKYADFTLFMAYDGAELCCRLGGYVNQDFSSQGTKLVNSERNLTTEMNKSGPLSGNKVTQFYSAAPRQH